MKKKCFVKKVEVMLFSLVMFTSVVLAQVANKNLINVQGRLTDPSGANKKDGNYALTFKLYNVEANGNTIWSEIKPVVSCKNGVFNVYLGEQTDIKKKNDNSDLWDGSDLWLETIVVREPGETSDNPRTLIPRQKLVSVGYAMRAQTADAVTNGVYITGSYANPEWITSLSGNKIDGAVANATNADTVDDLHAAQFLRKDQSDTMDGDLTLTNQHNITVNNGKITASNLNTGLQGTSIGIVGQQENCYGVKGETDHGIAGIYGVTTEGTYGVFGEHKGQGHGYSGIGVFGKVYDNYEAGNGVLGVFENDNNVEGEGVGVRGITYNYGYAGVKGEGTNYGVVGDGGNTGVYGVSSGGKGVHGKSNSGSGVYGESLSLGNGVQGKSSSGNGLYGESETGSGIYGYSTAGDAGVFGKNDHLGKYGVYGQNTNLGTGVYGTCELGTGVHGESVHSTGVWGHTSEGGSGVYGLNDKGLGGVGVKGRGNNAGIGVKGECQGDGWAGYFEGDVKTDGKSYTTGTQGSIINTTSYGSRVINTMESTEVWIEDIGSSNLSGGPVTINLNPIYKQTLDASTEIKVFVQLTQNCDNFNGFYVTKNGINSFTVGELNNGAHNVSFDYRILGKRDGYASVKLPGAPTK